MKEIIDFLLFTGVGWGNGVLGEAGKSFFDYIKANIPSLSKKIDNAKKNKG